MGTADNVDLTDDRIGELLRQVLHRYAQEAITEEQIERVLAPIRLMIRDGVFN